MYSNEIPEKLIEGRVYSSDQVKAYVASGKNRMLLTNEGFIDHGNYAVNKILIKEVSWNEGGNFHLGDSVKKEIILVSRV